MQCIAWGAAVPASASGPKAGTTMTNSRNVAVQRCMVISVAALPSRDKPHMWLASEYQ
jgi:hypothetical protein